MYFGEMIWTKFKTTFSLNIWNGKLMYGFGTKNLNARNHLGPRGGSCGRGTALKIGASRVRFPMLSLQFFHWYKLSGHNMAPGSTPSLPEMSARNISLGGGKCGRCVELTKLINFVCRMYWNLIASVSWNPQGLTRPLQRLLTKPFGRHSRRIIILKP